MRLEGERESSNVEDRRGGGGLPIGVAGGGIGTVVLVVLALLMGVDPRAILDGGGPAAPPQGAPDARYAPEQQGAPDEARRFVSRVLASTEDVWTTVFRENGRRYDPPRLVLFSGAVRSAHDCSDGGFAIALAESCFSGGGGADVTVEAEGAEPGREAVAALFSESASRVIVSV